MRLVEQYGMVWKLPERKYWDFIKRIASGDDYNINDYGKMVGQIDLYPLDMSADDAKEMLKEKNNG